MLAVRTEHEPNEVTLMSLGPESFIGIIGDLIRFQIEHRNRLVRQRLLRSVAVVQRRGIAAVWTHNHRSGKAVRAPDAAGCRRGQHLARRQLNRGRSTVSGLRASRNGQRDHEDTYAIRTKIHGASDERDWIRMKLRLMEATADGQNRSN